MSTIEGEPPTYQAEDDLGRMRGQILELQREVAELRAISQNIANSGMTGVRHAWIEDPPIFRGDIRGSGHPSYLEWSWKMHMKLEEMTSSGVNEKTKINYVLSRIGGSVFDDLLLKLPPRDPETGQQYKAADEERLRRYFSTGRAFPRWKDVTKASQMMALIDASQSPGSRDPRMRSFLARA